MKIKFCECKVILIVILKVKFSEPDTIFSSVEASLHDLFDKSSGSC